MTEANVVVVPDEPLGTISPYLHGQFAEHLGKCSNEGLWVGPDSAIPNTNGLRNDVLDALRQLRVSMLRWPGGCYADLYHWRDGIGPREKRPKVLGESCGLRVVEDGGLGTHEFVWLCREIGAEPYLAGNLGSGSPQEMCEWVRYCNEALPTSIAQERAENGHPEPMNVRYWGVGNENWGCGGHYDAEGYAKEFRRFATFLRRSCDGLQLVACGFDDRWNAQLLEGLRNHLWMIDHLSIHRYYKSGSAIGFTEPEYYELMRAGEIVERDVRASSELIRFYSTDKGRKVGIAMDEWGVWHPEATASSGYQAPSTLRDAVAAAGVLNTFHKWCRDVTLANMAQIVNVLQVLIQTDGAAMWRTPTYWLFWLYRVHQGATSLRVDVAGPTVEAPPLEVPRPGPLSLIDATASEKDGAVAVTVTNRSHDQAIDVRLSFVHKTVGEPLGCEVLSGRPNGVNSADAPDSIRAIQGIATLESPKSIRLSAPACSVQTVIVPVA